MMTPTELANNVKGVFSDHLEKSSALDVIQYLEALARAEDDTANLAQPTDQKGPAGDAKSPLHLLPPEFLHATAKVLALGGRKYGPWNWRNTSAKLECQTYVSAILRHVMAYQDGEDTDQESGESHIAHIAASCAILIDAAKYGTLHDNRPTVKTQQQPEPNPKSEDAEWLRDRAKYADETSVFFRFGNKLRAIADKLEKLEGGAE